LLLIVATGQNLLLFFRTIPIKAGAPLFMPKFIVAYVKYVDYVSIKLGRLAMYTIFFMTGVLLLGSVTRNILNMPLSWTVEMAQFILTGYYFIGGAYSMILKEHVRMDLLYDHFSTKNKARIDLVTGFFLLFYLSTLFIGSISSTMYAIEYGQRNFSQWNPSMIPIKVIMVIGIFLMILQTISTFFKDLATAKGITIS
jgi:TRAP-type mannitol/chloroaromatic compound transport system permease small subunit